MATKPQFYVYAFDDDAGCVYVGKGCKTRFKAQQRNFAKLEPVARGRIVNWYLTERAALEGEKYYIERYQPRLNVTKGGNGGRVRKRANRMDFWERRLLKRGSRKYAAQLLLAAEKAKPGTLDPSKVDAIRQVADGCRV